MGADLDTLYQESLDLLRKLVATPSFSGEEQLSADTIRDYLLSKNLPANTCRNNVYSICRDFDPKKPTLLLNSHHDTVKPNAGYTNDPFNPEINEGKLFGLGSNDAGGCLVTLCAAYISLQEKPDKKYNLVFAASAEEEISGKNGISLLLQDEQFLNFAGSPQQQQFQNWCAIVGEPTLLQMAIAERGLIVLDGKSEGRAGHAAREEGINALYKAMSDIEWFRSFHFPRVSELLGPVKMSVTSIHTENKTHNIIPASCEFVVDVRVNELYQLEEVMDIISKHVQSTVTPRSLRLRSSLISPEHPLVKAGLTMGATVYGSPTSSDKGLLPFPALKMGPGDSARSHTANEFIHLDEIRNGIQTYIQLIDSLI